MAEKRDLDEIDLDILDLLATDGRRSFREIADRVDLSPPAVSDRVDRLRDHGIIRKFTVDLDRTKVHSRTPILIEIVPSPDRMEAIFQELRELDGIEHLFLTVDGKIVAHGSAPDHNTGGWLRSRLSMEHIRTLSIDLVDRYDWQIDIGGTSAFQLSCVVCENPVNDEGITAEIQGEMKAFCCPSCKALYEKRLETHQSRS